MKDADLADEVIARLNSLITDPAVRGDVNRLIETRIACSTETLDHPTIQAEEFDPQKHAARVPPGSEPTAGWVGFLGLLNGLIGTLPTGSKAGWGYVTAVFDDSMNLVRFERTVSA